MSHARRHQAFTRSRCWIFGLPRKPVQLQLSFEADIAMAVQTVRKPGPYPHLSFPRVAPSMSPHRIQLLISPCLYLFLVRLLPTVLISWQVLLENSQQGHPLDLPNRGATRLILLSGITNVSQPASSTLLPRTRFLQIHLIPARCEAAECHPLG